MKRALLAWELGAGRAHIVMLDYAARALQHLGVEVAGAVLLDCDLGHELSAYTDRIMPSPRTPKVQMDTHMLRKGNLQGYAGFLGVHNFSNLEILRKRVGDWCDLITQTKADVVLTDHAPSALIAARCMGVPAVAMGVGFTVPPPEIISYTPPDVPLEACAWPEHETLAVVNAVLAEWKAGPLDRLPQIYDAAAFCPCTLDMFDPYRDVRAARLLPPSLPEFHMADRLGEEVFFYLSANDRHHPVILTAMMSLKLPVRAVILAASEETKAMMRARGVVVEEGPRRPQDIADTARIMVHAGNHGTSCLGIKAGLPQISIPQHGEQMSNAKAMAATGNGRMVEAKEVSVPHLHAVIHKAYEDADLRQRARALSVEMAPQMTSDAVERIVEVLRPIV